MCISYSVKLVPPLLYKLITELEQSYLTPYLCGVFLNVSFKGFIINLDDDCFLTLHIIANTSAITEPNTLKANWFVLAFLLSRVA